MLAMRPGDDESLQGPRLGGRPLVRGRSRRLNTRWRSPGALGSGRESYGLEGEHFGEHVVVAVDVQHRSLVLLGACSYEQVGNG